MSQQSPSTSGPAHRVQSAVEVYGYPAGHLGHLSLDEEAAFKNFKALCAENGYYDHGNGENEPPSHDDATLLRFLRARRFIVQEAWKQFHSTENWRKANQLDQLYETIDIDHYEETRRLYPQWTGRRDRRGIPVYVFEVKHLNAKTMSAYEKSAKETKTKAETDGQTPGKLLRLFALYENLTRFVMPLCSALTDREYPRTPITQSNNIVDISGVGLKQFWNLRTHMQDASTLATAHYPETLDRIFIIGAPAFFPTVWGWIKKWFDPITTSKIFILSHSEVTKTLESFIEPANIPKKYGGQLEFKFGDMPTFDPALKDILKWEGDYKEFPTGPLYWVDGKNDKEMEAIAVGHIQEKQRKDNVCSVTKLLRDDEDRVPRNGHAVTNNNEPKPRLPQDLLNVPTAPNTPSVERSEFLQIKNLDEQPVVQQGEVVPATRPEPVSFHTAPDGLDDLTLNEKTNGVVSHPQPKSLEGSGALDDPVRESTELGRKSGEGRKSTEVLKEKVGEKFEKVKEKVGL